MIARSLALCAAVGTLLVVGLARQPVRGGGKEPERAADQAAVRARNQDFLKAIAKGDPKEVASFWTATGEYARGGITIRGRTNIEKAYAEHFKTPKRAGLIVIESDSVRFLSDDTAVHEGVFVIKHPNPAETTRNHFSALFVRSGSQWHFGILRESPEAASLEDLAWLVGTWTFSGEKAEARMVVEWTEGKRYLLCRTTHKAEDQVNTATQILALHPGTQAIQSWTFESDGSLGEAVWSRTDKGWTAKVASYQADGDKVTATTVLTPIDENTFTFQSIDRMVGGEKVADIGPIKASRAAK